MADPTTLLEVADLEQSHTLSAKTQGGAALVAANAALTAAQAEQETLTNQLQDLGRQEASIRAQLAAAPMPADGEVLLQQLQDTTVARRRTQAALADTAAEIETATLDVARAQDELSAATTAAASASTAREQALGDDDRRSAWKTAVASPPVSDVKAQATAAANASNEPLKSAKARVEGDIPAELLSRARDRGAQARAAVDRAESAADDAADRAGAKAATDNGVPGKVVKAQVAFDRAVADLQAYALSALPDLQRALGLLAVIPQAPPLTQAESDRITETAIVNAGKAAATKEADRDTASVNVASAQADLDQAILAARATDIDADPSADAAVTTAQTALTAAQTALGTAQTAYTDALKANLDAWEATVPDDTWRLLATYEEATATLQRLKSTDPSTLATAATSKEADLVTALVAEEKRERTADFLADAARRTQGRLAATRNAAPAKTFSAIRGDAA